MFATHLEHALEVFHGNLLAMARSHYHSFVSISDHLICLQSQYIIIITKCQKWWLVRPYS